MKITMRVGKTNKLLYDQGFTYNEAGKSYNEVGVAYGGIYNHNITPLISFSKSNIPTASIKRIVANLKVNPTNKLLANQGYTYNQAGQTYNEVGVIYGGIYNHDIVKMKTGIQKV